MTNAQPQRTCVVTGRTILPGEGLRIVLAPDGAPAIDWKGRLPGRGAWVSWEREALEGVARRGRLNRAFSCSVDVPGDEWPLPQVRNWLARRQVELFGLALRAGQLKVGGGVTERSLKKGWATGVVLASDAGATVAGDFTRKATGYEVDILRSVLDADAIGTALGKGAPRSVMALGAGPLVRTLRIELKRGIALL